MIFQYSTSAPPRNTTVTRMHAASNRTMDICASACLVLSTRVPTLCHDLDVCVHSRVRFCCYILIKRFTIYLQKSMIVNRRTTARRMRPASTLIPVICASASKATLTCRQIRVKEAVIEFEHCKSKETNSSTIGLVCKPIVNECATNAHDCSPNAICQDTLVAYTCVCKDGFVDADPLRNPGRQCTKSE